jgi:hypothetical protein
MPTSFEQRITYSLDGFPLLLGYADGLSTWGKSGIVICVLTQKVQELIRVSGNQLSELGVAGAELLQNGLQHLWLLLDDLSELLKLSVTAQEVEVTKTLSSLSSGGGSGGSTAWAGSTTGTTPSGLRSKIEKVHRAVIITTTVAALGGLGSRLRRSSGGASSGSRLLCALGNTLNVFVSINAIT